MKQAPFYILLSLLLCFSAHAQLTDSNQALLRSELGMKINELRGSKGLRPLAFNDTIRNAAVFHSNYMAKNDVLTHDEKEEAYATPAKRVREHGGKDFEITGENVLYSTPQRFPMGKNEVSLLAEEMFQSWKNSPGHYANMVEPEYVYGDFGFQVQAAKRTVYATQVFGKKGVTIPCQLSSDAFGLTEAPYNCDDSFEQFFNLIVNIGNALRIEGNVVRLYYYDISDFDEIFPNADDGIAIDLISREQVLCGTPNRLDFSPIYDGILLKPVFRRELMRNNTAKSDYRLITIVGRIPENQRGKDFSTSLVLMKNGKKCKYIVPGHIPSKPYKLRPVEPIIKDPGNMLLPTEGIIRSQQIEYEFKTNVTDPVRYPAIQTYEAPIHSIEISTYSSVEGDSAKNESLHNNRARSIRTHIQKQTGSSDTLFQTKAFENWDLMRFQLHCFHREQMAALSHDSLKTLIGKDQSLPWDSLLYIQRKSTATIHYSGKFADAFGLAGIEEMTLRTAVLQNNPALANKALYMMNETHRLHPVMMFEKSIFEFFKQSPETVTNYAAILSRVYEWNIQLTTVFLFHWIARKNELDADAKFNLLHLYTLVGTRLLDEWDVDAERLANVVHPDKVNVLSTADQISNELMLNLHLTYIEYYGQVNDGARISRSFDYIADYFQKRSLRPEDDVDLALFFNRWSSYDRTLSHLHPKFLKKTLNEEGLFTLVQTMNFYREEDFSEQLQALHEAAIAMNRERWCEWLYEDFQILRDIRIKRMYCETCEIGHGRE